MRTIERWENNIKDKRKGSDRVVANKLNSKEREVILQVANSKAYCDLPPCKIVPSLADEGVYLASESTFYRILRAEKQLAHRSRAKMPKHNKPRECQADAPNQLWSWDITYLPTQIKGMYFYLYFIMDVYSRKVVGWSVHLSQSSEHAANLIKQACDDENIMQDQLILHSDNGSPMKGVSMMSMLEALGVTKSFSRPSVSNDNPYSESLFKTLKYHTKFPATEKFKTIFDARTWCVQFVAWYNNTHKHSGLKFITPSQRHSGEDIPIMENRQKVYEQAKIRNPERWSGKTRNWELPMIVTLNPNKNTKMKADQQQGEKLVTV